MARGQARDSLRTGEDIEDLARRNIVYRAAGAMEMLPVINGSEYIGMLPLSTIEHFSKTYDIKAVPLPFNDSVHDLCAIWHSSRSNESAHQWLRAQLKQAGKTIR